VTGITLRYVALLIPTGFDLRPTGTRLGRRRLFRARDGMAVMARTPVVPEAALEGPQSARSRPNRRLGFGHSPRILVPVVAGGHGRSRQNPLKFPIAAGSPMKARLRPLISLAPSPMPVAKSPCGAPAPDSHDCPAKPNPAASMSLRGLPQPPGGALPVRSRSSSSLAFARQCLATVLRASLTAFDRSPNPPAVA
jgi:hypothetical protein